MPAPTSAHLERALEVSPTAMLLIDRDGRIVLVNAQVEKLFGYERADLLGAQLEILVPHASRGAHTRMREEYARRPRTRGMGARRDLHGLRRDGSEVSLEIGLNPLGDGDDALVLASVVDLTDRQRSEQRLQTSVREKDVLLREVHHRVKNNLQIVSSLLNLQRERLEDPLARKAFLESQLRVRSIALVHEKLYREESLSHVEFGEYARSLLGGLVHSTGAEGRVTVSVETGDIKLPIDQAIPCGLIVNELVTNALKHAFPGDRTGTVQVKLLRPRAFLELRVEDDGVGLPESLDPARTPTLGLELVYTFAEQLEATVDLRRDRGTAFRLRFQSRDP